MLTIRSLLASGALLGSLTLAALPVQAQSEQFVIDAAHTHVQFSVSRFGFADTLGSFKDVSGTIDLDEEDPESAKVAVTIATASLDSDHDVREEHLTGPHWFNVAEFPEMTFTSNSVERTGESTAKMSGDLTILGVTQPVTLDVTLNRIGADPVSKAKAVGFSATTKLDRTAFGMETAVPLIAKEVSIRIELLALQSTDE